MHGTSCAQLVSHTDTGCRNDPKRFSRVLASSQNGPHQLNRKLPAHTPQRRRNSPLDSHVLFMLQTGKGISPPWGMR